MAYLMQVREQLREELAGQMRKVMDEMASGRCADFADYRRMVGITQGLRRGVDAVDAVFHKLLDDEGDELE